MCSLLKAMHTYFINKCCFISAKLGNVIIIMKGISVVPICYQKKKKRIPEHFTMTVKTHRQMHAHAHTHTHTHTRTHAHSPPSNRDGGIDTAVKKTDGVEIINSH